MTDLSRGTHIVTGGAGLIGSAIIWALNRRGIDDILVVDRLDQSAKWKNLVPLRYRDYLDADDFERALVSSSNPFGDLTSILHLGACSSTTESDAAFLMRNNYGFTKNVANFALEQNVRLVYASSAATYGSLESNLSDACDLQALRPLNMYAYSKHLFDLYAQRAGMLDRITGIKYFNVFGPNESHKGEMRSLADKAYEQIRATGAVKLFRSYRSEYRDGEQRRDFLYVQDAAEMTLHLAERDAFGLYNAGSGEAHTWLELVGPIFEALGIAQRVEFVDMPEHLQEKYQYCTCANIERLRATGYARTITPLARAVDDYVRNYLVPDRRLDPAQALEHALVN